MIRVILLMIPGLVSSLEFASTDIIVSCSINEIPGYSLKYLYGPLCPITSRTRKMFLVLYLYL